MQKKTYTTPTVVYVGPDMGENIEVNAPITAAVATAVVTGITLVSSRVW